MPEDVSALLDRRSIVLDAVAADRDSAIRLAGQALVDVGAVTPDYVDAMIEREQSVSTYMGEGVAIPHGTLAGKDAVQRDALSFLRFPDGVEWNGQTATLAIGIAAKGDGHLAILGQLASVLVDPDKAKGLREVQTADEVLAILAPDDEDDGEDDDT
jgi:PTS system mannitol-specific IIA component